MRAVAIGLLLSVASFVALIARAVALYPGGTWFDFTAPGHDFFRNFLCDLTQPVALNGVVNRGAPWASAGMIALDCGLLLVWLAVPLLAPSRLGWSLRTFGTLSFLGVLAVPLTPSIEHGVVHALAVLTGTLPGIAAGILANVILAGSPHVRLQRLGLAILVVSAVDAALYVHHVVGAGPPVLALPALQRVALVLLLSWMMSIAVALLRVRSRG